MTRRDFGKLFAGAMVGLGLKAAPVLTAFPDGIPWPIAPEEEAWLFVNQAAGRIWPIYKANLMSYPKIGDVISPFGLETDEWLKEQDIKFGYKELA